MHKWTRDERTEQVQELGKGEKWAGPKRGWGPWAIRQGVGNKVME